MSLSHSGSENRIDVHYLSSSFKRKDSCIKGTKLIYIGCSADTSRRPNNGKGKQAIGTMGMSIGQPSPLALLANYDDIIRAVKYR